MDKTVKPQLHLIAVATCTYSKLGRTTMDFTGLVANFLIVLVSCMSSSNCADESSVYFALMVSSTPTLNTSGVVPEVDQALGVINRANSNVLPGIRLQYTSVLDTQVRQISSCYMYYM